MARSSLSLLAVLALFAGCTGDVENPQSASFNPTHLFDIPPPEVVTGWPCPPFDGVVTTQDKVGDTDLDGITDCQEEFLGSDGSSDDSDGDGVGDFYEVGALEGPLDTDGDAALDLVDPDDDGDGVPTIEEDDDGDGDPRSDDLDADGVSDFIDDDDDGDDVSGLDEDLDADGDPRNDDFDDDGTADWHDTDDDDDGAPTLVELSGDTDGDGDTDRHDLDDDGDGILTADDDTNGNGDILDEDFDADGDLDFQDADDDNDTVPTVTEDLDGDGVFSNDDTDGDGSPDWRDFDDDADGVPTQDEDTDQYAATPPDGELGIVTDDDTDEDGTPDYLDANDDGDTCTTLGEDINGNMNAIDDDSDANGTPDYLEATIDDCNEGGTTTGTPVPTGPFALTVSGTVFLQADGTDVIGRVVRDSDTFAFPSETTTITAGAFDLVFPAVLDVGETYTIEFFVDGDASGSCETLTEDLASYTITGVETSAGQDEVVATDALTNLDPAACASFP